MFFIQNYSFIPILMKLCTLDLQCKRKARALSGTAASNTSSECSPQRQVLHCKRRNLGCSSAETQEPRLQFCRRQIFHCKLRNQGCSFTRDLIGAVVSRCFPHPTLSLASEQTLKDLKRSQGPQHGGKESIFG